MMALALTVLGRFSFLRYKATAHNIDKQSYKHTQTIRKKPSRKLEINHAYHNILNTTITTDWQSISSFRGFI